MSDEIEDFLLHYGVKGMKWGVRREGGTPRLSRKSRPKAEEHARARQIQRKKLSEMSNQELRDLTTRLNLEQQYNKLNPNAISRGKGALTAVAASGALAVSLYNLAKHPLAQTAKKFISEAFKFSTKKAKYATGITKAITS